MSSARAAIVPLCVLLGCGSRSGLDGLGDEPSERRELATAPEAPEQLAPAASTGTPQRAEPELLPSELPAPAPAGCVDITRSYTSVPSTVVLLIDQSASMTVRFGASTRWDVLREAIVAPDSGLLSWLAPSANIGLMLYSSLNGFAFGRECPLITSVPIAFGLTEALRDRYLEAEPTPEGDTPTGDSIALAVDALNRIAVATPKYILLVTDGEPDTCAQPDPQNGLGAAIAAAQSAFLQGIRVFTVGLDGVAPRLLQQMANAGAGKPIGLVYGEDADAEEPLFASTDPRLLADQLKGVIGDVRACTIDLRQDVGAARALEGRLSLDGSALEYGDADGWTFVDEDTVEIHGAACGRVLGEGERLEVRFPCLEEFSPR